MANESIEISKSGVDAAISDLRNIQEKIEACNKSTNSELGNINEAWQGADATLYVNRMKEDYAVLLERYAESLDSYIEFLAKVYPKYEEFDQNREEVGL